MSPSGPAMLAVVFESEPHARNTPQLPPGNLPRSLFLIPCALYLYRVHFAEPWYRAQQRERAQGKGLSVEDFRDEERWQIQHFWSPYMQYFGRRNRQKECVLLSLGQNSERSKKGEPEIPVYRPLEVKNGLTLYLRILTKAGPKGPNHLYTMIRR